jgi:RNA-directed DNA polymerase
MIDSVANSFPRSKKIDGKQIQRYRPKIIRYADDFVVIANTPEVILEAHQLIANWLNPLGLELKPEKTRLCNTLTEWNGEKAGFDFLGFNIQHYSCSIHKGVNTGNGGKKQYQLNIKPSRKAVKNHYDACKKVIKQNKTAPQATLIKCLNPIIRGWSNYYSTVVSKEVFSKLDHMIWSALRAWTHSRCGKASFEKLGNYFSQGVHGNWTFQTKGGMILLKHAETPIKRHIKVKGTNSPYDGNWVYWSKRMSNGYGDIPTRVAKLIKRQKGRCNHCGQYFASDDLVEIDHIQPKNLGGKNTYSNLQLLHRHCHDEKTRNDISQTEITAPMTRDSKLEAV